MTHIVTRLIVFVVVIAAIAVVSGTGAFSLVDADRPAEVVLASDLDGAYLGMAPHDGANGAFARDRDGDGTLELEFNRDTTGVLGDGPNPDAVTRLGAVFNITNYGTQPVGIWLADGDVASVTFFASEETHGPMESRSSAYTLHPGQTVSVGIVLDARGEGASTRLLSTVTVHADSEAAE